MQLWDVCNEDEMDFKYSLYRKKVPHQNLQLKVRFQADRYLRWTLGDDVGR